MVSINGSIVNTIISFSKVDFYVTFYNYKKPINANLPRKLERNSDTKWFANSLINIIIQLNHFVSKSASTFQSGKNIKEKENTSII